MGGVWQNGYPTLAERHLRIDSCGLNFADRHLRTRHRRTDRSGSTFADRQMRINISGPDICGPGNPLRK